MDPGAFVPDAARQVTPGGLFALLASATALIAGGASWRVSRRRRTRRAWKNAGEALGLMLAHRRDTGSLLPPRPFLCGVYRGRAVEAGIVGAGQVRIAVRIANPRRLFDDLRATPADPEPDAVWLNDASRAGFASLRESGIRRWSVSVHDHLLTLLISSPALTISDSAHLRQLTELACDLAEVVDRSSPPAVRPPASRIA